MIPWLIDWLTYLIKVTFHCPPPRPTLLSCIPCLSAPSCWRASPCSRLPWKTTGSRREFCSSRVRTTESQMWWLSAPAAPSTSDPARLKLQSQSEQRSLLHWSQYPAGRRRKKKNKKKWQRRIMHVQSNINLAYLMREECNLCVY